MKAIRNTTAKSVDAALSTARQTLHRFAAISFLDPRAGSWKLLRQFALEPLLQEAAQIVRNEPRAAVLELGLGELPLEKLRPDIVLKQLPASPQELNEQYEAVFGLLVSSACPPYENRVCQLEVGVPALERLGRYCRVLSGFGWRLPLKCRSDTITSCWSWSLWPM